jgi:hypothetical protein
MRKLAEIPRKLRKSWATERDVAGWLNPAVLVTMAVGGAVELWDVAAKKLLASAPAPWIEAPPHIGAGRTASAAASTHAPSRDRSRRR